VLVVLSFRLLVLLVAPGVVAMVCLLLLLAAGKRGFVSTYVTIPAAISRQAAIAASNTMTFFGIYQYLPFWHQAIDNPLCRIEFYLCRVNEITHIDLCDTLSPLEGDELLSHSNGLACPQRDLLCEQWLIRWLAQTTSIR
jgi:hypothetical protein